MTNTEINIGIRHNFGSDLGERNYESGGGQLYSSVMNALEYEGVIYTAGQTIPYDADDHYGNEALMEMYFNAGWLTPVDPGMVRSISEKRAGEAWDFSERYPREGEDGSEGRSGEAGQERLVERKYTEREVTEYTEREYTERQEV